MSHRLGCRAAFTRTPTAFPHRKFTASAPAAAPLFNHNLSGFPSRNSVSSALGALTSRRLFYDHDSDMSGKFGISDVGVNKLNEKPTDVKKVSDEEWKKVLPADAYEVTRNSATEPAGSGAFDKHFDKGRYVCLCCGCELFNSEHKFWAGCGWPAFSKSVDADANITRITDNSYGMERVEVRCKQCDAHLGHVFDDGPAEQGGERYCINSVSMAFEKAE